MRKMWKKTFRVLSGTFASILLINSSDYIMVQGAEAGSIVYESKYESIDISTILNKGGDPPQVTSTASAIASEKQWFEYLTYSDTAIGSYNIYDGVRVLFFDPYDYSNALIMEVDESLCDFSSANSLEISYTTGNSMSFDEGTSTETSTDVTVTDGQDITETTGSSTSTSKSKSVTESTTTTSNNSAGGEVTAETTWKTGIPAIAEGEISTGITISYNHEWGKEEADAETNESSSSESSEYSKGISTIADRICTATGTSVSTNKTWSTEDSTTVTKSYAATYFNQSGSPLQWKIISYTVYMPLYTQLQHYIDGEWVTTDTGYCLLVTIQGECRSWIENNTVYYEHWGTGEPVTQNEFWQNFFTKEQLIAAYSNKLYPDAS